MRNILQLVPDNEELTILDVKFSNYETARHYANKHYFRHPSLNYSINKRKLNSVNYDYKLIISDTHDGCQVSVTISKIHTSENSISDCGSVKNND